MSWGRTRPADLATRRNIVQTPQFRGGRETGAEIAPPGRLLEYSRRGGDQLRAIGLFYGGQSRAGHTASTAQG
jgi:hypothetical protein